MPAFYQSQLSELLASHRLFTESNGKSGEEIDFSEQQLNGVKLSKIDLSETFAIKAIFESCTFIDVDFYAANLSHSTFRNCRFSNCNLSKTNLHGATFENSTLENTKLSQANIIKAALYRSKFNNCDISHSVILETTIHDTTFTKTLADGLHFESLFESNKITGSTAFS